MASRSILIFSGIFHLVVAVVYLIILIRYLQRRRIIVKNIAASGKEVMYDRKIDIFAWLVLLIGFIWLELIFKADWVRERPLVSSAVVTIDILVFYFGTRLSLVRIKGKEKSEEETKLK